jgi:hypothetical protein
MTTTTRFRANKPPVIQETIDGETIMVNLHTGCYYWLNPVASYVTTALQGGAPVAEVVEDVATRFPGDASQVGPSVEELVEQLVAEELVVALDDGRQPEPPTQELPALDAFEAPVLRRYTDMQELLLLDPVHEVGAEGWPEPR